MKKILFIIVCLMAMVVSVNAQNGVADEFTTNDSSSELIDNLVLNPQKSIKENYEVIKNLMDLHKEKDYKEYSIMVKGHYTNKNGDFYESNLGFIRVKEKDNERFRTISGQIIYVLAQLYSNSLDERFNVGSEYYDSRQVNQKDIKVATGRTFKSQNGKIIKEYVTRQGAGNTLYSLYETSPLYIKIYKKVMFETGLTDKGSKLNIGVYDGSYSSF